MRTRGQASMKGTPIARKRTVKETVLAPVTQHPDAKPVRQLGPASPPAATSPLQTARRSTRRREPLTFTPAQTSLTDAAPLRISPQLKQVGTKSRGLIPNMETSEIDSTFITIKSCTRRRLDVASQSKQVQRRRRQEQSSGETDGPPGQRQRGRKKKMESGDLEEIVQAQSAQRIRPRFELKEPDSAMQDESLPSSDLLIDLSQHEEWLPTEEESEEEEELPSFPMKVDKKPITGGQFVWHKFRHYPFWPALVKSVHQKQKKASIMFIDYSIFEKTRGFTVPLKSLKPFDCEEASEMMREAKEQHDAAISWSMEMITDYWIQIACGSFSGSFIEYFAHDLSYPVRRKCPQDASERLNIPSDAIMMEESCEELKDVSLTKPPEDVRLLKRLLPDRTEAAYNRANKKLVHFIVKQRMVEGHLLAVIGGQQQSRWLQSYLRAKFAHRRNMVNIYLEDDQQIDEVYQYLSKLYATARVTAPCLPEKRSLDCSAFVLEGLFPEAIIYAIAGVDSMSVKMAEEKYLKGRTISNRERQEFEEMIAKTMRK